MNPALVDKALGQTYAAGLTYAAVPLPWLMEWMAWAVERGGASVPALELCGVTGHSPDAMHKYGSAVNVDEEGNVLLCLLDVGHDGECGYGSMMG